VTPQSKQYIETVLEFAQEGFLHTSKVHWADVRAHVFEMARDAQTSSDTYPALHWLADHLSSFMFRPHTWFDEPLQKPLEGSPDAVAPRGQRLEKNIGYV
jgi:hypothetical protein